MSQCQAPPNSSLQRKQVAVIWTTQGLSAQASGSFYLSACLSVFLSLCVCMRCWLPACPPISQSVSPDLPCHALASHKPLSLKYRETFLTVSGHFKIDKTKVLKPCGSLMRVKSTAECSRGAFCNTFDLH